MAPIDGKSYINGTIDLNKLDRNIRYHKAQENYEGIDVMVSMHLEGKIEWLQELGPIVKQSLDVSDGTL